MNSTPISKKILKKKNGPIKITSSSKIDKIVRNKIIIIKIRSSNSSSNNSHNNNNKKRKTKRKRKKIRGKDQVQILIKNILWDYQNKTLY